MKTKLRLILLVMMPFTLSAQINKKQWLVGGNIVGQYQKNSETKDVAKELRTPIGLGYFIADKLAVGIRGQFYAKSSIANYMFLDVTTGDRMSVLIKEETKEYAVGPFMRYYFLPKSKFFNVYLEGYYSYGSMNYTKLNNLFYEPERTLKTNTFNINLAPVLILNKHVSLEFIMAYYLQKPKGITSEIHTFLAGVGLQVHLGRGGDNEKSNKIQ